MADVEEVDYGQLALEWEQDASKFKMFLLQKEETLEVQVTVFRDDIIVAKGTVPVLNIIAEAFDLKNLDSEDAVNKAYDVFIEKIKKHVESLPVIG